jgi:hypothetical protein
MQLDNPYNQPRHIRLPPNIQEFNGKHLQVLARNESANTTGFMQTSLYGGVLSVKAIGTIRCLVKNTTVVGITYPEKKGGYPKGNPVKIDRKRTIIVDQCGLQWQNSIYNTGALFFYPTENANDNSTVIFEGTDQLTQTTLGEYRQWQNTTYFTMYGSQRPPFNAADPDAMWIVNGQNIRGKLKSPVVGFKTEFKQAFESVRFMADKTPEITKVHFKFLRAGLGFFSENIHLTPPQDKSQFLETARLEGIRAGIRELGVQHQKIKKIILPFQPSITEFGGFLVTSTDDVFEQDLSPDVTIATTNCADPHAGPGNEGRYQSVDAAIASNTYMHHLNAAYNYANIQSKTFEEIGAVVIGAAAAAPYSPPGAALPPYSPGAAAYGAAASAYGAAAYGAAAYSPAAAVRPAQRFMV